ncbi:tumor necrosis factor receptor superfamily member 1B isoform X2 [Centropristis striata]|uniref:tumor necrosis factor receptor superfamily member 1B isoform X2 n=1 Tax=Centropristis striata TaxID=184440 RepID=UPI0027E0A2A9|nr:tumor necrosis factor receptor superfamily member 1B isoform X2 [Centropristis striata]
MTDILLLLVLLIVQTPKVSPQPYQADSEGNCLNRTTEYLLDDSDLCCKKCPPGQRLKEECSRTKDTVCENCPAGQYMENWNYAPNCISCNKCKKNKGLQDAQKCSSTVRSLCVCQPGMFCVMGFEDPYCTASCNIYSKCRSGSGVSLPGTGDSDVRCERCPSGMFSDTASSTDRCRNHTNCRGRAVVRKGDATSDNQCEPESSTSGTLPQTSTKEPRATATTVMSTAFATSDFKAPLVPTDSTLSIVSEDLSSKPFAYSTKPPPPSPISDTTLAAVIAGVVGILLFVIILLVLCKIWKKDAEVFHPKVDANGNCESGDKIKEGYIVETQLASFTVTSAEQQCLLQNGEACSDHSQSSNNTETSTRTDGLSSQESIGPLQSTLALHNPLSVLSEPLSLLSDTEPVSSQPSFPSQPSSQPSSQPTSPQVISPVTSPSVNVNITVHIGNGSCGTPSITPRDLMQVDSILPFGEEEKFFSNPQQEDGKQSLMSVQESYNKSESYNT